MQIWRICRRRYAKRAFDGEGSRRAAGRWNLRGDSLIYASPTLSLAALEAFVNLNAAKVPTDLVAIPGSIPDEVPRERWEVSSLPRNWRDRSLPLSLQQLGSAWIRSRRTAVLLVPSAIIPEEFNTLLNPAHPEFHELQVGRPQRFLFDARMWKRK